MATNGHQLTTNPIILWSSMTLFAAMCQVSGVNGAG